MSIMATPGVNWADAVWISSNCIFNQFLKVCKSWCKDNSKIVILGTGGTIAGAGGQVDSKDMGFEVWRELALRCAHWLADTTVKGIVITHGTDTLEETAWFLQSVLAAGKPVVLTCAMRPATALAPDGPQNILDAVTVALDPLATGVVAVCAGVVHSARDVQKDHPYRLDAFSSGDAGPLGFVEENAVRWVKFDEKRPIPASIGLLCY
jgi:L-asparaginase